MIDYKEELNSEQLDVVLHGDGPCLVLAGAGSGKTRTITYRVAYLLEQGIKAENILLVTFTNKAAHEMIDRVQSITGGQSRLPWAGTFHHIAYRILRKYAPLIGYKNNFSVLDSEDSKDLLKLCLKQEGIDKTQKRFPSPAVINSIISYARNAQIHIAEALELKNPKWADLSDTLARIADDYAKRKKEANVMDFDDLLVNLCLLLLNNETMRKKMSENFQYVLVDEYQDTNKIQASIVNLFSSFHKNILVVGDDAQSIYSFRAADIRNILDFEKQHPNAKIFRLQTNYRSTEDILKLANEVIANNQNQYRKELKSKLGAFARPELRPFADQHEEAEFIAERILELRDEGVKLPAIAVLFRASHHSQFLEMELMKRDIPYDYRGGIRFFERSHIKDILAFLRIINNKEDVVAWSRILNMQTGIGPSTAEVIINQIRSAETQNFTSLQQVQLPARAQIGWNDFLSIYKLLEGEENNSADLIKILLASKYAEYLEFQHEDYRERLQDIEQMILFAEQQDDLAKFLAEATMQESYKKVKINEENIDQDGKIILSTVHQAKGLEWEAVFIINLAVGQFPNERATKEDNGLEEERRLFYVAITRAKKHLCLSYPLMSSLSSYLQGPSLFLDEIDKTLVSEEGVINSLTAFDDGLNDGDVVYEKIDEKKPPMEFLRKIEEL